MWIARRVVLSHSKKQSVLDRNSIKKVMSESTSKRELVQNESPASKKIKLSNSKENNGDGSNISSNTEDLGCKLKHVLEEDDLTFTTNMANAMKTFKILDSDIGKTWFDALEREFRKEYFTRLDKFVTAERAKTTVYPDHSNVWEWTKHCAIQDIKVVILGQDPYHGPNQAHGLCFSVKHGVPPPPSLVNIFKELKNDIPDFKIPSHGCLQGWTKEGVLLLNAVLTVEAGKANSHKGKGWESITHAVISWISKNSDSVVFMLWGAFAQKMASNVDKRKHHLLTSVHPSPLSAHRGFLGCKHFSKANELLQKAGKTPVNWNNL